MWKWLNRLRSPSAEQELTFWVSTSVLATTSAVLHRSGNGRESHEGIVYWAGRRAGTERYVTTCIAPTARTSSGSFDTSSRTNAKVVAYLARVGLELIGQVHSHPGASVDHSEGDDRGALMPYQGFVSVVVPHYAARGMQPLTTCGVHVFEGRGFRRLSTDEVARRLRVIADFSEL